MMKAVILAAGEGIRMRPFTYRTPKPMARILGQTIIEHNINQLPDAVTEIVLVVRYLKEQIMDYFGNKFGGRKVHYVELDACLGTGDALFRCKDLLTERFLVLMGDDMYTKREIEELFRAGDNALLVKKIDEPFAGGSIIVDESGNLLRIDEGVHTEGPSLLNAALYVLTPDIFKYDLVSIKDGKEFGLPQTLVEMARLHPVRLVHTRDWIQITTMDDLKRAEGILRKRRLSSKSNFPSSPFKWTRWEEGSFDVCIPK